MNAVGRAYERLAYTADYENIDLIEYLRQIINDLEPTVAPSRIQFDAPPEAIQFAADRGPETAPETQLIDCGDLSVRANPREIGPTREQAGNLYLHKTAWWGWKDSPLSLPANSRFLALLEKSPTTLSPAHIERRLWEASINPMMGMAVHDSIGRRIAGAPDHDFLLELAPAVCVKQRFSAGAARTASTPRAG